MRGTGNRRSLLCRFFQQFLDLSMEVLEVVAGEESKSGLDERIKSTQISNETGEASVVYNHPVNTASTTGRSRNLQS
jgi:hypothetical protein